MLDSVQELLRLQAAGELTAVDIVRRVLATLESTEPSVNAFTHIDAEGALEAAERVDAKRTAGQSLGLLAGIPIAVKDVLCTRDMPTTCSSNMLRDFAPPYDATVIERLRRSDAVIIGKTNMDEFAMGASTETSAFGVTRNPWDLQRTPGGSSGGAAACVAAGVVPLSLGSDTGGSIRQPAAFCGVTGLKPTYGRVSRYGLVAFASSLDQVGPLAWSVADAAILLDVIAGFDPRDSTSLDHPVPNHRGAANKTDLKGVRVGVVHELLEQATVSSSVRQAVQEAMSVFRSAGAEIVPIKLPHSEYCVPTYYVIAPCEASSNLSRYDGAHYGHRSSSIERSGSDGPLLSMYRRSREEGFGSEVKRRIMIGTYALSAGYVGKYYNKALSVRRLIRGDYDAAFQQADLLLGPVTPTTAFRLGEKIDDPLQMYLCDLFTTGANLAGIPALSLPAGFDEMGLPVGIHLQGPALAETALIAAGSVFQSLTDHHRRRPPSISGTRA